MTTPSSPTSPRASRSRSASLPPISTGGARRTIPLAALPEGGSAVRAGGHGGFTLLEVIVSLMLSGLLVGILAQVMGQALHNNRVLQSSLEHTTEMTTFRRILHRDLQNIVLTAKPKITSESLSFETSNNFLSGAPLPVIVVWRVKGNRIVREESVQDMGYESSMELLALTGPSKLELLDPKLRTWVDLGTWALVPDRPSPLALRMTLRVGDGEVEIVERVYSGPQDQIS